VCYYSKGCKTKKILWVSPQQAQRAFKTDLHKTSSAHFTAMSTLASMFCGCCWGQFWASIQPHLMFIRRWIPTKFPGPIQVSGDQTINNTLVSTPVSTIQLPKLTVPHFSGHFAGWPSFYDSFTQLIHEIHLFQTFQFSFLI